MNIPFCKPYYSGNEIKYIKKAMRSGKLSGNGKITQKCQEIFENKYQFKKCFLTTSCTDALEMSALLLEIRPGDEVIMPSYTFVSTANAFTLRGAKIVFIDSRADYPGIDESKIEESITPKTRAIVPVHYAGIACDMDKIMAIAKKHSLYVVEDAAQAIDSYYIGKSGFKRPLGGIGHLAAFSFHDTKNIIAGEGGLLVINDDRYIKSAEIIWEKGTNRAAFWRGEVDKYHWVDIGSSFLPSEITAAFLLAQLEILEEIQERRKKIWSCYDENLQNLERKNIIRLPIIPKYATNNAHMYYIICRDVSERGALIAYLKRNGILSVFHYDGLHQSEYYKKIQGCRELPFCEKYSDCLLRLPMFYELKLRDVERVSKQISRFYDSNRKK